jgi:DNA-binding transcriptional regulator YhcF (GntR family)
VTDPVEKTICVALNGIQHDASLPVYLRIYQTLKKMILTGALQDGSKFPSDKDLVRSLPFSHITLAKALNELRKQGLLERGRAKGTFVKTPKKEKRPESSMLERQVAVIFDDVNPEVFHSELFVSLSNGLKKEGLGMFFITSGGNPDMQFEQIKAVFNSTKCVGCLVWSILSGSDITNLMRLKPIDFPIVFMGDGMDGCDCSLFDDDGAGKMLARLALENKYDKVAIIAPAKLDSYSAPYMPKKRIDALRACFRAKNKPDENVVALYYTPPSDLCLEHIERLHNEGFLFATFSANAAVVLKRHWDSLGHSRPPRLISFGPSGSGILRDEKISEIHFNIPELSENALELFKSRLNGDRRKCRHLFAKAKFIERETFQLT